MPACTQCGKPAVFMVGDNPLCVDCNLKVQQAVRLQDIALKEQANFYSDHIEAITGMYGITPRYTIAQPVMHDGPMTFHNIKIDNSVVGAINTGEVKKIDVALSHIRIEGNTPLQQALSKFTEAVISSEDIEAQQKNEILEQLAVIAEQTAQPPQQRKTAVVKALLLAVKDAVSTISTLSALWQQIHPAIIHLFQQS
jgi:hypothetical protein